MICKQCGSQLSENAKFCSSCGFSVAEVSTSQAQISKEETVKVKEIKTQNNAVKNLLSVLCCIMIFMYSMATISISITRAVITEDNMDELLDDIDVEEIIDGDNLNNFTYRDDSERLEELYEETFIEDFVRDTSIGFTNYMLGGPKPDRIDADDMMDLIEENRYEIENALERRLTDRDFRNTRNFFENEEGEDILEIISAKGEAAAPLYGVRLAISVFSLILSILITLIFVFLLFKIRRFELKTMIWAAIPLIASSLLFVIAGLVGPIIASAISTEPAVGAILELLIGSITGAVLINGIIALLIGGGLIAAYFGIKKAKASKTITE